LSSGEGPGTKTWTQFVQDLLEVMAGTPGKLFERFLRFLYRTHEALNQVYFEGPQSQCYATRARCDHTNQGWTDLCFSL